MTPEQKQHRWQELYNTLYDRSGYYARKSHKARSQAKSDDWWAKYQVISRVLRNTSLLKLTLLRAAQSGDKYALASQTRALEWWKQREADRKEYGRNKFLSTHTYAFWFYSNSFSADYGTFTCDRCGATFYHSPSTITKAAKEVYHCCCGNCTNEIIYQDHQSTPYQ